MDVWTAFQQNQFIKEDEKKFYERVFNVKFLPPPEGLMFRRATIEDYERIQDFTRNTFSGHDYMYYAFPAMLRDPNKYFFVAEKDGKVLSLCTTLIVDDGKTVIVGGSRTDTTVKGLKFFHIFEAHCRLQTFRLRPGVMRARGQSPHIEYWTEATSRKKDGFSIKFVSDLLFIAHQCPSQRFSFMRDTNFMSDLKSQFAYEEMHFMTRGELSKLFSNKRKCEELFPKNVFLCGLDPFEPMKANIDVFLEQGRCCLTSQTMNFLVSVYVYPTPAAMIIFARFHGKAASDNVLSAIVNLFQFALPEGGYHKVRDISIAISIPRGMKMSKDISSRQKAGYDEDRIKKFCQQLPCYENGEGFVKVSCSLENNFAERFPTSKL